MRIELPHLNSQYDAVGGLYTCTRYASWSAEPPRRRTVAISPVYELFVRDVLGTRRTVREMTVPGRLATFDFPTIVYCVVDSSIDGSRDFDFERKFNNIATFEAGCLPEQVTADTPLRCSCDNIHTHVYTCLGTEATDSVRDHAGAVAAYWNTSFKPSFEPGKGRDERNVRAEAPNNRVYRVSMTPRLVNWLTAASTRPAFPFDGNPDYKVGLARD